MHNNLFFDTQHSHAVKKKKKLSSVIILKSILAHSFQSFFFQNTIILQTARKCSKDIFVMKYISKLELLTLKHDEAASGENQTLYMLLPSKMYRFSFVNKKIISKITVTFRLHDLQYKLCSS